MSDNVQFTYYYSLQKSELEANMKVNTQGVTQEPLLSDGGDIENLFQILVSGKSYHEFQNVNS